LIKNKQQAHTHQSDGSPVGLDDRPAANGNADLCNGDNSNCEPEIHALL
jgi:hypothetical protein